MTITLGKGVTIFYMGPYPTVDYYDDLPPADEHPGEIYIVLNDSGVVFIDKKYSGMYYSNGATWVRLSEFATFYRTSATSGSDNRLLKSDGTGGNGAQESGITIDDSNNMSGIGDISFSGTISGPFVTSITGTSNQILANGTSATPQNGAVTLTLPTTLIVPGTIAGSNLSGTNTGDVTIAGQNYLSLVGQVITANSVDLGTSNITGTLPLGNFQSSTGGKVLISGATASWSAFPTIGTLTLDNQNSAGGSGVVGILKFNSILADSNYINFGGSGRNIGITNASAIFFSSGVDWESASLSNTYVYTAGSTAATVFELTTSAFTVKTAPGGTINTAATLTSQFSINTSGVVSILSNVSSSSTTTGSLVITGGLGVSGNVNIGGTISASNISGTNSGDVTLSGENYLSIAGQVITANSVSLSGTNVTGTLTANKGGTGNATYAVGDILAATGTTTLSRLAKGDLDQVIQSNGTNLNWTGFLNIQNIYVNNSLANLTNTNAAMYVNPGSPSSAGNYINMSAGRNFGVTSSGALFTSFNLDYDATSSVYKYNATVSFALSQEISNTGLVVKYSAGGLSGATATLSNGFSIDTSGNISATNLSGTNTGNVTLSGENYLSIASQVITANAVNVSGTNITGTLKAAAFPALTGDVTTSAGSLSTTIANNAVTMAKIVNIATSSFLGRITASTGNVEVLTVADAKTLLSLTGTNSGDVTLSGENYLSLASQVITVNAVNLAGTNVTGSLPLSKGGTNANLTASTGGIFYSTASAGAILSGTATANKILLSGATAAPTWSTSTIPTSAGATANKVLLSDGTNYVLSTPTFPNASATSGKAIISDGTNWIASTPTFPNASATSGKIIISDGTNWVASTSLFPNSVGTSGKILRSDGTTNAYTTSTFADTYSVGTLLYAGSGNVVSGLATANNGVLITSGSGVPSISSTLPSVVLGAVTKVTVQSFPSGSGTYTTPANCTHIRVRIWGGGGGGGGVDGIAASAGGGGGGGGGGYVEAIITSPSATYSYAVGPGGSGGAAGANNGSDGTDTTFSTLTASGGSLGTGSTAGVTSAGVAGGAGGIASGGDLNAFGGGGGNGITTSSSFSFSGYGGSSPCGGGNTKYIFNANGGPGQGPGGGGAGGASNSATDRAGGTGASGKIIVEEYYVG